MYIVHFIYNASIDSHTIVDTLQRRLCGTLHSLSKTLEMAPCEEHTTTPCSMRERNKKKKKKILGGKKMHPRLSISSGFYYDARLL